MRINFFVLFIFCLLVFVSGCSSSDVFMLSSSVVDKSLVDYSFVDYAYNCSVYSSSNVSLLYGLNFSGRPSLTWFDGVSGNWSVLDCVFTSDCSEFSFSSPDDICSNNVS
jgi:hypothetical protein